MGGHEAPGIYRARIVATETIAAGMKEIALELPQEVIGRAEPGQCAHVKVGGEFMLRRPISMYSKADGYLHLAIQGIGEGTRRLLAARQGDELDLLFPFGNGFRRQGAQVIWLVGGGVGVAPLRCCAEAFSGNVQRAYFGFRSKENAYAIDECERAGAAVRVTTEDGSLGEAGLVTLPLRRGLERGAPDVIMACGPTPMLRAVRELAREFSVKTQLSLEQRMGCGMGACLVCSCAAAGGGYLRVCADGPVFNGEEVAL